MLLPGCQCCGGGGGGGGGGVPCVCECKAGKIPSQIMFSLEGPQGTKFKVEHPIYFDFLADFGSGAQGTAFAPGGTPPGDSGPISDPKITNPGSGYAKFGRIAPTLTISGGGGEGATFVPTLASGDEGGFAYWFVSSISITGGSGYDDGSALTITASNGDTVTEPAAAKIGRERKQPNQENPYKLIDARSNDSAKANITWAQNDGASWGVADISLVSGGSGYTPDDYYFGFVDFAIVLEDEDDAVESAAHIRGYTSRQQPFSLSYQFNEYQTGTGAVIQLSVTEEFDEFIQRPFWVVTGTVVDGGSGYNEFGGILLSGPPGTFIEGNLFADVDEYGVVTGISGSAGAWTHTGVIESLEILHLGEYYGFGENGVEVLSGGKYYRESPGEPPYVSDVTVAVRGGGSGIQYPGGFLPPGVGAEVAATVDANTSSATFGQIVALSIVDGGEGYMSFHWGYCDCEFVEGQPLGAAYEVPAYEFHGLLCRRIGRLCYRHPHPSPVAYSENGGLLGLRLVGSYFDVECPDALLALWGMPGWDGGPVYGFKPLENWQPGTPCGERHYAIPGRVSVQPNSFSFNGSSYPLAGATVTQNSIDYYKYWSVASVLVPSGINVAGIYDGAVVEIFSNTASSEFNYAGKNLVGELGVDYPGRAAASGVAVVNEEGKITGINITYGGVFYDEYHSTPNPDPKINDPTSPAIVVPFSTLVTQRPPSNGSGAVVRADVNDDTRGDFGRLEFVVVNGGDGYLDGVSGYKKIKAQHCGPSRPVELDTFYREVGDPFPICDTGTYIGDSLIEDCNKFTTNVFFQESKIGISPAALEGVAFQGSKKCCGRSNCEQFFRPGSCRFPREVTVSLAIGGEYTDPVTGNKASVQEELNSVVLSTSAYSPGSHPQQCASWLFTAKLESGWNVQCSVAVKQNQDAEPTLEAVVQGDGSGAVLSVDAQDGYGEGLSWGVVSISVESGGEGYSANDRVLVTSSDADDGFTPGSGFVGEVDENGAILSVGVSSVGAFRKSGEFYAEASAELYKVFLNASPPKTISFNGASKNQSEALLARDDEGVASPGPGDYCPEELGDMEFELSEQRLVDGVFTDVDVGTISILDVG